MTWIPPIAGLERRDPEHRYWLGDVQFPISVTAVLQVLKSSYALERIEASRATWAPRGTETHRAMELYVLLRFRSSALAPKLQQELEQLTNGDHEPWIEPLINSPQWDQITPIASERPTCCLRRRVAGTYDLAYDAPQGRILADLKSLGTPAAASYCTRAQLGGYMALEATWGHHYDYGQTIWARPGQACWGRLYSRRECLIAWAAAWTRWRQANPGHIL